LACSYLLKPLNRNSERIPVFFLAGLASEFKTDNIPYSRSFPAASGGELQKLTLLTGYNKGKNNDLVHSSRLKEETGNCKPETGD